MDGGMGLRKGLLLANAERQQADRPLLRDQRDHFHIIHRARRARRGARRLAIQTLQRAEKAQAKYDHEGRTGVPRSGMQRRMLDKAWRKAEQAIDQWTALEVADRRLQAALPLITPDGVLNTRKRAEAEVQALLAGQTGDDWVRAGRLLTAPGIHLLGSSSRTIGGLANPGRIAAGGGARRSATATAGGAAGGHPRSSGSAGRVAGSDRYARAGSRRWEAGVGNGACRLGRGLAIK